MYPYLRVQVGSWTVAHSLTYFSKQNMNLEARSRFPNSPYAPDTKPSEALDAPTDAPGPTPDTIRS